MRIQGDAQADADHIRLNLTSLFCFNITGNAILRHNRLDFISVNNIYVELARDVIHHFAAIWIERTAQPERAAHHPRRMQLAHRETIAEFVRDKTAPIGQRGTRLQHTRHNGPGIIERDKVINMFRIGRARHLQWIGPAPGGNQQRIVRIAFPIVGCHYPFLCIDLCHHRIGNQRNIALFVPGKIANHHLLLYNHTLQKARQRHPVIQWIGFIRQHMNTAIRVVLAQYIRGSGASYAIANDYVASIVRRQM